MLNNFLSGTAGGVIGTILNTPFDVVKTRVQNRTLKGADGSVPWTFTCMRSIIATEGYTALYKGFVPKVIRLGPGGGILLVVFETVLSLIKSN